ncbi:MAG: OmpH family outer membrane protein [Gammaproteobacteria bacterium]|nr:MAG: OmpH family outer membrane protein [Gammaproteobacteria bacterium]
MIRQLLPAPILAACLMFAPAGAFAQAAPALKIGVVNFARLIQESPQAKVTLKALEDEFSPRQRDLIAKQTELKGRQEKLQKDASVMGAEERRNAESRFQDDQRDLGRRQNEFVEDFNVRRNEELGKLQRDLLRQVQAFAKERGYDLLIGEGVIYATDQVDVTDQVLKTIESGGKATGAP